MTGTAVAHGVVAVLRAAIGARIAPVPAGYAFDGRQALLFHAGRNPGIPHLQGHQGGREDVEPFVVAFVGGDEQVMDFHA